MKHLSTLEFKDAPELSSEELMKKELADLQARLEKKSADDHAALKRRIDELEAKASRLPIGNRNTGDDALAVETKALNKFLRGGVQALDDIERKTMNIGSQASGGYVVAPEYSTRVIEKLVQFSPLRGLASVMSIGTTEVYIPVVTDQADGGWVTETGPRPTGESAFDQVDIKTYEYAGVVPVSRQLLEDSIVDLSGLLSRHLIKKFGKSEAASFMVGDGNGKPTGLLHTPGSYSQITAKQDGTDLLTKLIDTFYALPDAYASVGSWLMKRETMGVIRKLDPPATAPSGPTALRTAPRRPCSAVRSMRRSIWTR
ncbi:phage major capsid protein [Bradyrhizobium sp. Pha-3]|uniref:phage major capsid protein n=1 Tax=Bradyrhizobium sp. Pha-3 TaxID=208375 RepID=UPI0035D4C57A